MNYIMLKQSNYVVYYNIGISIMRKWSKYRKNWMENFDYSQRHFQAY